LRVRFKDNVRIREFSPEIEHILFHLRRVEAPVDAVWVTSGNDSTHMTLSKHYTNQALDVRSKNFPSLTAKRAYQKALQVALGTQFAVILEYVGGVQEHFHIQLRKGLTEFQP
jgi:hydrogenase maturation factor HypF (carbamoyltransferase family)